MRIGKFPKLLLASGLILLSSSVLAQRVPQVGGVDAGGSPNQGGPVNSQPGSVPPPLSAQQLMEFSKSPSYSISQLKADPCINNPCLKAAESIDPKTHEKTDLDLFQSGAKSIGADVLIEIGIKEKVLGISGAKLAKQAIDLTESPVIPILENLPYVGKVAGQVFTKAATGAWAVTFEPSVISVESELPIAIKKEFDAKQAAAKARNDAIFENIKLQNIDQKRQKDAMNAAAAQMNQNQTSTGDNLNQVLGDFMSQLNRMQQKQNSSSAQPPVTPVGAGGSPILANAGCLSPFVAGGCKATPVLSGGCNLTAADRAKGKVCTAK